MLPPYPEADLCHSLGSAQAASLLRIPPGDRGVILPSGGDNPEPGSLG